MSKQFFKQYFIAGYPVIRLAGYPANKIVYYANETGYPANETGYQIPDIKKAGMFVCMYVFLILDFHPDFQIMTSQNHCEKPDVLLLYYSGYYMKRDVSPAPPYPEYTL